MAKREARNTIYAKTFNEDCRQGGIYHLLDSDSFKAIINLNAHADSNGFVRGADKRGCTNEQLQRMLGLKYRAVKRALHILGEKGLIKINYEGIIELPHFVDDQVYREHDKKGTRRRRLLADRVDEMGAKLNVKVDKAIEIITELKDSSTSQGSMI